MAKTTNIEIKDLPILNVNGVNYYAFNVAIKYLKQHNAQFKGMSMKKFKEVYGEDSIFKLTGCGSWITVELFNELANVLTKVVVKTVDEEIRKSRGMLPLTKFMLRDAPKEVLDQIEASIPTQAMEKVVSFEQCGIGDGYKLINAIEQAIKYTKDFHSHGYTSVRPHVYENGDSFLIGNGVLLEITTIDWENYHTYNSAEHEGWESHMDGKLCRFVDTGEYLEQFIPCGYDFSGMTPRDVAIECWNKRLFKNEVDFFGVHDGSIYYGIRHEELLELLYGESTKRLIDLTEILEQEGIKIDSVNRIESEELTVVEADYYEIESVTEHLTLDTTWTAVESRGLAVTDEDELVIGEEVETSGDEKNDGYDDIEEVAFNPYEKAKELGFDLSKNKFNTDDRDFRDCETVEEINEKFERTIKLCGNHMNDFQFNRYSRCADFWTLKLLASQYEETIA